MTVLDDMAADAAAIFTDPDGPARSAVYRPKAGGSFDVAVIVEYSENLASSGSLADAEAILLIQAALVAEPKAHDEVEVDGKTWSVHHIMSGDGIIWKVAARRDLRATLRR